MMTEAQKAAHEKWLRLVKEAEHSPERLFQILTNIAIGQGGVIEALFDIRTLAQQQTDLLRRIATQLEGKQ